MFINPLVASLILSYRQYGSEGSKDLLKRAIDYLKIKDRTWYARILLVMPLIYFLSYAIMRLTGLPLPDPKIPIQLAPAFFLLFFPAAVCEEVGWMGYAIEPMQNRWGALKASIILGVVWGVWHIIPHRQQAFPAKWIVWQSLYSVALRILIVWFYNRTGKSVFAATLVHSMDSVSWSLFPNYGSHYNPLVTSLVTFLVTGIAILGWGSKASGRRR
jgi:membrane protease YdiL (CAAX protease family)